jgi:hypothetical protein
MRRVRNVGRELVRGLLGVSALAVLVTVGAGAARGQGFAQSPPPPSSFNPNFPASPNLPAPNLNFSPPNIPNPQFGSSEDSSWYLDLAKTLGAFVIIVGVLLVVALVFRQLARARATTDPARLAASDYWIQSQLRQASSDESGAPPPEQSAE